jgi:hypothetical protein
MALVLILGLTAGLAAGTGEITTGFAQIEKIVPSSTATGGHFGNSVDVEDNIMIAGSPYQGFNNSNPGGPGHAQVSVFSDWDGSVAESIDLSASDGLAGDLFGMRVAIGGIAGSSTDGGVAYVSAPRRPSGDIPHYAGAVYVFAGEGDNAITEISIITPSGDPVVRGFGTSMAFDGVRLAVGAPYDSTAGVGNHGAVYIYTLGLDGVPISEQRVECDLPTSSQYLGWAVSIDGDRMAVSAIADSVVETGAGAVYIFDRQLDDSWTQAAIVTPVDLSDGDWFGKSLVLNGDLLVVSSMNYGTGEGDDVIQNMGIVYLFEWDGFVFQEVQQIEPPQIKTGIAWGVSIDFDGSNMVIGCSGWQNGSFGTGAAAAYQYGPDGQFINGRVFIGSDVGSWSRFGFAVALHGDRVVIGAIEENEEYGGAVYVFEPWCGGDFDYDGLIDHDDILDVIVSWGNTGITTQDVEQDFEVGIHDLLAILRHFGTCF